MEEGAELAQFAGFIHPAEATNVIDNRMKELLSLAIGVTARCVHCIR